MKIILCAFGRAGLEAYLLIRAQYNLSKSDILVFTHLRDDNKELLKHLQQEGVKFITESINKHRFTIESFKAEILVSVYYRNIIKKEIIDLFSGKAFNAHPSLLPFYRGALSSVWAILNAETHTGISFHFINEEIDEGNIISQHKLKIFPDDTAYSLYHRLISLMLRNLVDALNYVLDGGNGKKQIGEGSYFSRNLPFNGVYDLDKGTFEEAERFIRAMYFPPHPFAKIEYQGNSFYIESPKDIDIITKYTNE